jgi:hypothetical protein
MGTATGPHPGATAEKAVPFPSAGLSIQIAACALLLPVSPRLHGIPSCGGFSGQS